MEGEKSPRSLLDPDTLQQLFRELEATDIDEFEMVCNGSRLYLRRDPGRRSIIQEQQPVQKHAGAATSSGVPIVAPLTGVYYSRPSPEHPAYVSPGEPVQPGQVVALIETMKLFNEVVSEIAGTVIEVAVQDGDLVEVGQPMVFVQPLTEKEPA